MVVIRHFAIGMTAKGITFGDSRECEQELSAVLIVEIDTGTAHPAGGDVIRKSCTLDPKRPRHGATLFTRRATVGLRALCRIARSGSRQSHSCLGRWLELTALVAGA